eukprot:sb/3462716/
MEKTAARITYPVFRITDVIETNSFNPHAADDFITFYKLYYKQSFLKYLGGFFWEVSWYKYKCEKDNSFVGFRIACGPKNSTKDWSCTASFSIAGTIRKEGKHIFSPDSFSVNWDTHFPWDDIQTFAWNEKFIRRNIDPKVQFAFIPINEEQCEREEKARNTPDSTTLEITFEDIFIDQPTIPDIPTNTVTFSRNVRDFDNSLISQQTSLSIRLAKSLTKVSSTSHEADGKTWHMEGYKEYYVDREKNSVKFNFYVRLARKYYETDACMFNNALVVIILHDKEIPTIKTDVAGNWVQFEGIPGTPGETNDYDNIIITFVIQNPNPAWKESHYALMPNFPKRFDFGRENISVRGHGNFSFTLKDASTIAANSFILAYNSLVLKELVEEAGEIEHDVSDFEPEAVRIFVDVCYSGTLNGIRFGGFKVFCDFVKMIAVFKVEWAFAECVMVYQMYKPNRRDFNDDRHFDDSSDENVDDADDGESDGEEEDYADDYRLWDWALLALKLSVKFGKDLFLDQLFRPGFKDEEFHHEISGLLVEITQRSHLDLLMALVVQWDLKDWFLHDLLTLLKSKAEIPLLKYLLETFNFSLFEYEKSKLKRLNVVLLKSFPKSGGELFKKIKLEKEEDGDVTPVKQLLQLDGTLATIARNRWYKIKKSNWPCTEKRPYCSNKRDLPDLC